MSSICTLENDSSVLDDSLLWSTSGLGTDPVGQTRTLSRKPGVVDIWKNLLLLSDPKERHLPAIKQEALKHYDQGDFKEPPGKPAFHIGSGVSFSVIRKELADQSQDGKPVYVAVKTLNILKRLNPQSEDARVKMEQAADVVLKELRLLTHQPLRNHDNIAKLLGYHSDQTYNQHSAGSGRSDIALVMEYSPHGTVKELLLLSAYSNISDGDGLGPSLKVHFMRDIAAGLKALHDCGVAHGDLKLDNTLVFPESQRKYIAKISDFGNSLLDISDERRRYCGTPSMNAPEIRRSASGNSLFGASEILKGEVFSIGLMMWEILLDGHPFTTVIKTELKDAGNVGLEDALNALPPDELLLQALLCTHEYEETDRALYQVIRDVFQVALRDEPDVRGSVDDVLAALGGRGISFRKDHRTLKINTDPPKPLPTMGPLTQNAERQTRLSYPRLRSLPLVVRDELVLLLGAKANDTSAGCQDRYDAQYDLAMCMINGVHTSSVSLKSGLRQLERAAVLGSPNALSIIFRLYRALSMKQPVPLQKSSHPLSILEGSLDVANEPMSYMSRRIIACERLYQQELLRSNFSILHQGECLVVICLLDLIPWLFDCPINFGPEDLECVPCGVILGVRPIPVKLLHLAARLNLKSLVEYLLITRPKLLPPKQIHVSKLISHGFLSSACEGGHLDMLSWIVQREIFIIAENDARLFHFLIKFSPEDAKVAMTYLLIVTKDMIQDQVLQVRDPGMEFFSVRLQGTALEFAITTDNKPLLGIFLGLIEDKSYKSLLAIGWTNQTFNTAVSLHLWHLIPMLAPLEHKFRMARPDLRDEARYRKSQAEPALSPFGLFEIGTIDDPTLPFLIHGKSYSQAVEKTINEVISQGCCSINDIDSNGKTALFYAMESAVCDYSVIMLHRMIEKGARFAPNEVVGEVSAHLFRTKSDRVSRAVLRLLLKHKVFRDPPEGYLLGESILAGNLDVIRMLCGLDTDGTSLPVWFTVKDGSERPGRSLFTGAREAKKNNLEIVKLLQSLGVDLKYTAKLPVKGSSPKPVSPLEEAILEGHSDVRIINYLIEIGADVFWGGRSVLTAAAARRDFWVNGKHITEHLLRHPRVRNFMDREWKGVGTPLTVACRYGNFAAVSALLDAGADLGDDSNVESLCNICSEVASEPWKLPGDWETELGGRQSLYQWRCQIDILLRSLRHKRGLTQGRTLLHFAVETGNGKRVIEIVEADPSLLTKHDDFGRLPIDLLDDKEVPYSDTLESYFPVILLRRYLQTSLAEKVSSKKDCGRIASVGDRQMRRRTQFAADGVLGWESEEVALIGQPLIPFRRRYLLNQDFLRQQGDISPALNEESSQLTLDENHGCELSILTTQYAHQALTQFEAGSEQSLKAQIRAIFTALVHRGLEATRARAQLQEISSCFRESFGTNHPIMISCDIVLMQATSLAGHLEEATTLLQQVISRLTNLHGSKNMQSIFVIRTMCNQLITAKRFDDAEIQAQAALDLVQEIPGIGLDTIAEGYELVATCNMQRADYEAIQSGDSMQGSQWFRRALDALKPALEIAKKTSNAHNWQTLTIILEQSKCHLCLGEYEQCRALCMDILGQDAPLSKKKISLISSAAQRILNMIGIEGQSLTEKISTQEKILDTCYTEVGQTRSLREAMFVLAESYEQANRYPEAIQLLEKVLDLPKETTESYYIWINRAKHLAANVYSKMEMWGKAEAMQRDLIEGKGDYYPSFTKRYYLVRSISHSCFRQQKFAEAEQMSRLALSMMTELGEEGRVQASERIMLANFLIQQDSLDGAEELIDDALKILRDMELSEHETEFKCAYVTLTRIFRAQGRYEDLISCQLQILQRDPNSLQTRVDLMDAYIKYGRTDKARSEGTKLRGLLDTPEDFDLTSPFLKLRVPYALASNYLEIGDYQDSMTVAEGALARFRASDSDLKIDGVHSTVIGILTVLQCTLQHLGIEKRLYEVSKELSDFQID